MASDITTSVTAVVSVIDKATPALADITQSLKGVGQAAQQVSAEMPKNIDALLQRVTAGTRSLDEINRDVARSTEEQRRQLEAALGPVTARPWEKIRTPDIAPVVQKQVEEITAAADKLDAPIAGIGNKLRASLSRTFSDLGKQVGTLGAAIKARVGGAWTGVVGLIESTAGRLKTFFTGIGGFLAGAGIAEAIALATAGLDEFAKTAQKLGETSRTLGIPVETLQELQRWARDANLPVKQLETNMAKLTRALGTVRAGTKGSERLAEAFGALGITDEQLANVKNVTELMPLLAKGFAELADPAERARVGFVLFGANWQNMVDALRAGPEAIDAAAKAQQQLGVITQQQVEQVQEYQRALRGVGEQWRGIGADFRSALGEALLPVITPVLQQLEAWLKVNREWLKLGLKGAVEGIASAFTQLGAVIGSTSEDFKALAGIVEPAVTAFKDVWKGLKLPEIDISADPITQFRDAVVRLVQDLEGILAGVSTKLDTLFRQIGAPFAETWLKTLEGVKAVWEGIAAAIGKVTDTYEAMTGAWNQLTGSTPPAVPAGVSAPSPGGGPIPWEQLGGPQPGGLLGAAGQPANGRVDVNVTLANAPPGTRATTQTTGTGVRTQADVGYSMPWTQPAYSGPWAPAAG
jgi:methyl-accepting chemotaxis protein